MPDLLEMAESLTGRPFVPTVDPADAHPAYLGQALLTGRSIEQVQADALERARQAGPPDVGVVEPAINRVFGRGGPNRESAAEFAVREFLPLAKGKIEERYRESLGRYRKAQASDEDLTLIARYEAVQKTQQEEGTAASVGRALANVPKILLEATAGGRAVAGGKALLGFGRGAATAAESAPLLSRAGLAGAARAAPRTLATGAATTPFIPDMYYADAQARATRNGGHWLDTQNIAPAVGYAILQSAVLGHAQRIAGATTPTLAGRAAVGGAVGLAEQQGGDVAASLVDDFLIENEKAKVGQKYGAFYRTLTGEPGAQKELAAQIATFSLFSTLQGQGPKRSQRSEKVEKGQPEPPPDLKSEVLPKLIDAAEEATAAAKKVGLSEQGAAQALAFVTRAAGEGRMPERVPAWMGAYETALRSTKPAPADPLAGMSDADVVSAASQFVGFKGKSRRAALEALAKSPDTIKFLQLAVPKDALQPRRRAISPEAPDGRPAGDVAAPIEPATRPEAPEAPRIGTRIDRDVALREAKDAAARGESAVYVDMDIDNMAGLVKVRGADEAVAFSREAVGIIREELAKVGAKVEVNRHAGDPKGDEFSAVVIGADKSKVNAALDAADARIAEAARAKGLADIPHAKEGRRPGVGVTSFAEPIRQGVDPVVEAEAGVESRKASPDRPRQPGLVEIVPAKPPEPAADPDAPRGTTTLFGKGPASFKSKKGQQGSIEAAAREAPDRVAEEWAAERGLKIDKRSASGWFEADGQRYEVVRQTPDDETSPLVVRQWKPPPSNLPAEMIRAGFGRPPKERPAAAGRKFEQYAKMEEADAVEKEIAAAGPDRISGPEQLALALRQQNKSVTFIAQELGVTTDRLRDILKDAEAKQAKRLTDQEKALAEFLGDEPRPADEQAELDRLIAEQAADAKAKRVPREHVRPADELPYAIEAAIDAADLSTSQRNALKDAMRGVDYREIGRRMDVSHEQARKYANQAIQKLAPQDPDLWRGTAAEVRARVEQREALSAAEGLQDEGHRPIRRGKPGVREKEAAEARVDANLPAPPVRTPQVGGIPGIPGTMPGAAQTTNPPDFAMARARVTRERAARGQEAIAAAERFGNPEAWSQAREARRSDPQAVGRLLTKIDEGYTPSSDGPEVAMLLLERVALANAHDAAASELIKAQTMTFDGQRFVPNADPAEVARLRTREEEARRQRDRLDELTARVGTRLGRGLQFFRQIANEDYSLGAMLRDAEVAKGKPLTPEEKTKINELSTKIAAADAAVADEASAKPKGQKDDAADRRIAAKKLREEFAETLAFFRRSNQPPARRAMGKVLEFANIFRVLNTAYDFSALLRQGGFMAAAHPVRSAKAVPDMLKAFASERAFDRQMDDINQRAYAPLYKGAGLFLADVTGPFNAQEEAFAGRWVKRIPGVKASERAYAAVLNRFRADAFDALVGTLAADAKPTMAEAKAIAHFVNVATGRGSLGKAEPAAGVLAQGLFSPRYLMSRLQLASGQPLWGGTWRTRKLAAQEYGRALMGIGAFYAVASLLNQDEKITFDPRSSDFGKIRFGQTRLDPLAGLAQITTFGTRLVSGETVDEKGKARDLREKNIGLRPKLPKASSDTGDVIMRFLRNKMAPVPGAFYDLFKGHTPEYKPATPREVGQNLVLPFGPKDVYEVMTKEGMPRSAALALLAILGMGVKVHGPKTK